VHTASVIPAAEPRSAAGDLRAERFATSHRIVLVQGVYYFLTGVWPLVSIDTFQMVTGPKTDLWLVRTVGVLITVIALAPLAGVRQRPMLAPVVILALGSALGLTAIDVVYVTGQVIAPIYLLDAVAELVLIVALALALFHERKALGRLRDS